MASEIKMFEHAGCKLSGVFCYGKSGISEQKI
mgnify:FL=1